MKRVRLLAEAEAEVDAALAWYRREVPHRLSAFADAFDDTLESIGRAPESCSHVDLPQGGGPEVRRGSVLGFPWGVFFLEVGAEVVVIAVAHVRREPGYWRDRTRHGSER